MKKTPPPPATPPGTLEEARNENPLRIRRRSVANLTEHQMEDAAGGHPHPATCEPTCPATCCPTCPRTCGACPQTVGYTCPATCGDGDTCYDSCPDDCYGDSLDVC